VKKHVQGIPANTLLNASEHDLIAGVVEEFRFDVPTLKEDEIHIAESGETQVDVRSDPMRYAKPEQVERLAQILEYVEKRLHPWWVSTGRTIAWKGIKRAERQITKLGVPKLAEEAAAFFEVKESSRELYVHAIPIPEFDGKEATANPTLNNFCIEITKDFNLEGMEFPFMLRNLIAFLAPNGYSGILRC
jgi:hypothetical protein